MRVFMHLGLLLAAFSPTCGAVAVAQDSPASLFGGDAIAPPPSGLNVWRARSPDRTPVVIFLEDMDGLGTRRCQIGDLFRKLNDAGISVAIFDRSHTTLRETANAVEDFLENLRRRGRWFRLDLSRIAIAGCGTGAQFAALAGLDPSQLERAGFGFSSLKAVAIIQSAGFDPANFVAQAEQVEDDRRARRIRAYFDDSDMLRALSLPGVVGPPDAPAFLFVEPPIDSQRLIAFGTPIASGGGTEIRLHLIQDLPEPPYREARERRAEETSNIVAGFLVARLTPEAREPR